jgi:hypothetical protein
MKDSFFILCNNCLDDIRREGKRLRGFVPAGCESGHNPIWDTAEMPLWIPERAAA